jgi:hypothetical protein
MAEAAPAETVPVAEAPAEAAPTGEAAVDTAPVADAPAADAPVTEAPTETASAPAAVEPPAPAEDAVATAEAATPAPAAEPEAAAALQPAAPTETVAETGPTALPDPVAEPEPAAEAALALAAPEGTLRAEQVNFAAWDIELPFIEDNRIIGGQRTAIVRGILPGVDVAEAGTWLAPGLLIYSVNGNDVQLSGSIATTVLNTMSVDPDGKARVVVEYAGSSLEREVGLMTVPTTRLVSLGNGLNAEVRTIDGEWRTIVTGVTVPEVTELRQGDVLYRDRTTGIALDSPEALEKILATLVEQGIGVTSFSVLRDSKIQQAAMQLAAD